MSLKNSELIWQGMIHLGDEPGVFSAAHYAGLRVELPVTLQADGDSAATTLVLGTANAATLSPYPGHLVTVVLYALGDDGSAYIGTELAAARLTTSETDLRMDIDLAGTTSPMHVGVRVEVDATVPPGLYNDFLLTSLSNGIGESGVTGSFGFLY